MRAYKSNAADRDGRIFEQRFGRVGPIYNENQLLQNESYVLAHLTAILNSYLADRPNGIVTHRNVLRV